MKKLFCVLIAAMLMFNVGFAQTSDKVERAKSRIQTISDKFDSIAAQKAVALDSLELRLDDTIILANNSTPRSIEMTYSHDFDDMPYGAVTIIILTAIPFVAAILIIFICLVIGYKRRTAKYKIIQLAIENGYELPEYLFNENTKSTYVPKRDEGVVNQNGQQSQHIDYSWASMKSGIKWTATGIGLCLFFLFNHAMPMVGICSIVLIIGASKLAIAYNEQRNRVATYTNNNYRNNQQAPVMPPPIPNQGDKDCNGGDSNPLNQG